MLTPGSSSTTPPHTQCQLYPHSCTRGATTAAIAMGSKAIRDQQFYSCLHQKEEEVNKVMPPGPPDDQPDFSGTQWDLIRAQAASDVEDDQKLVKDEGFNAGEIAAILLGIDEFSDDLKKRL